MGTHDAMTTRPQIAIKIAECIAEWAEIETVLGMIVCMLQPNQAKTALAMYLSVESRAPQLRMLRAAVASVLSAEHAEVVNTILLAFVRPVMTERDRLAHWCWGYSPDIPDALLLIEPDEKMEIQLDMSRLIPGAQSASRDRMLVVKEPDLVRMLQRFRTTKSYVGRITGTIWTMNSPAKRAQFLQQLSNEPPIREALDRQRSRRENKPAVQPE
jgi:hypothetical protein